MSIKPHLRYLILASAVLLGVLVLLVSVLPINRVALGTRPGAGFSHALIERADVFHVVVHVVGYGMLACLGWFMAGFAAKGSTSKMIAFVTLILLGYTTEWLQHRVYHNRLELNDIATNLMSVSAVFGLLALWERYRKSAIDAEKKREEAVLALRDVD